MKDEDIKLVVVYRAANMFVADLLTNLLKEEGIPAMVNLEHSHSMMPHLSYTMAPYGIEIYAAETCLEKAKEIIDEFLQNIEEPE